MCSVKCRPFFSANLARCKNTACVSCSTDLSESRKGQTSGTGGVEGRSFANAMMCSKVMSVWVHTSTTWISWGGPWGRPLGVRLMTCTTTGSLAARKASAVSSWLDFDSSFPFTCGQKGDSQCNLLLVTVEMIPATDGESPKMVSQRPLCFGPKICLFFLPLPEEPQKRDKNLTP